MTHKLNIILSRLGVVNVVSTVNQTELPLLQDTFTINEVRDARSATFEAFGILKMTEKPVAVIVDEAELAGTLTATTEVWFQRKDLLLITVNGNLYQHFDYLDRCIVSESILLEDSNEDEIINEIQLRRGPHLLRTTITTRVEAPIDYSVVLQLLSGFLSAEDAIMLYHPTSMEGANIKAILPQHRYCTVSKYIGNLLGAKGRTVLCVPERLLAYESNIFNFRNLPDLFFLVVLADGSGVMDKLAPWIESNGIKVIQTEGVCDTDSIHERKPKLVYIKK